MRGRVADCRLSEEGVAAVRRKYKEGRWVNVPRFCESVDIQRATYFELIGRKTWFEGITVQDKLIRIGITDPLRKELYEYKPAETEPNTAQEVRLNNLPAHQNTFIGRSLDLENLKQLLSTKSMVTLLGPGGCGKTRLALQVAREIEWDYRCGVLIVQLVALTESKQVPLALLSALRLREEPGAPRIDVVAAHLKYRNLLLILDNCEHLVGSCGALAARLLHDCPHVKIIATSRERLNISCEHLYRVPNLEVPPLRSLPNDNEKLAIQLLDCDSLKLFVDRARVHFPKLVVTGKNSRTLHSICHRLDGIPLAIELAAARVRAMTLERLDRSLGDCLKILVAGNVDSLPHHRKLEETINWSYERLSRIHKLVLLRFSVFVDGCYTESVEQMCAGNGINEADVLALITSLVDKSLITYEDQPGGARYRQLESVRQFAAARLDLAGEYQVLRQRHCACYVEMAARAEAELEGEDQQEWFKRLEADYENYRAALTWSLSSSTSIDSLRLCGSLKTFWHTIGYYSEGRAWCDRALATPSDKNDLIERAGALNAAGVLANSQGDHGAARAYHAESLFINREYRNQRGIVASLTGLGIAALRQGDLDSARSNYEEGLTISREVGNSFDIGKLLLNLGNVAEHSGDYSNARRYYEESLSERRRIDDRIGIAYSLLNLGNVADCYGEFATARAHYEASLAQFKEIGDRAGIANSAMYLGNSWLYTGNYGSAKELYQESASINKEIGNRRGFSHSINNLGTLALCLDDDVTAMANHEKSLAIRREIGDKRGEAASLIGVSNVFRFRKELGRAKKLYEESLSLFDQIGDQGGAAWCLYFLGNLAYNQGDRTSAVSHHRKSLSHYRITPIIRGSVATRRARPLTC